MTESIEKIVRRYREEQKDTPAERWRKPVRAVAVEDDTSFVEHDGQNVRPGVDATFDEETIERFRQGYVCLKCWEPHPSPFPERCSLCRYPMAQKQTHDFGVEFGGEKWVGPTTTLSDEYERMLENGKRNRHVAGSSVLLPGRDF